MDGLVICLLACQLLESCSVFSMSHANAKELYRIVRPLYHTDVLVTMVPGDLNIYCEGASYKFLLILDCVYAKNNSTNLSFYFIGEWQSRFTSSTRTRRTR